MEKIMIYPYNKDCGPIVRHPKLLKNHTVTNLVSPRGWGLENSRVENGGGILSVSCDFEKVLPGCTAVWFVEDSNLPLPEKLLQTQLSKAIDHGKKIIYTRYRNKSEFNKMVKLIPPDKDITAEVKLKIMDRVSKYRACYEINTPVIAVLGALENTDKYEIQAALREEFIARGYSVSSVSSRRDSDILGMHSIPDFMLESSLSGADKILQYNYYIKQIESEEKPEVIIIGIPGGAIPFDKFNHNDYGILTYEISRAVSFDCAIMTLPYFASFQDNFEKIGKEIYDRFRISVDYFHMAAITEDITENREISGRSFITLDGKFIRRKLKTWGLSNVCDLTERETLSAVTDKIIDQLSDNCTVMPV